MLGELRKAERKPGEEARPKAHIGPELLARAHNRHTGDFRHPAGAVMALL